MPRRNAFFLTPIAGTTIGRDRLKKLMKSRRGVAAVLAMMFLILFGSLSAAMAIASRGNIITAATHLHVSRAQSAAETGLEIARSRLMESANRFLVSNSDVDEFGWDLWSGNLGSVGNYVIVPPKTGRQDLPAPSGLCEALAQLHGLDTNVVAGVGVETPTIANAQAGVDGEYQETNWLFTPAVAVEDVPEGSTVPPLAYSVTYAPLANGTDVRVIVTGYDFGYQRSGQPITRTVMQDFRLVKRVNQAIISPSRIMIGKNVMISGDLGARYTDVARPNGDPLIIRSDFYGLSPALDAKLDALYAAIETSDVDGDNRLRLNHPTEGPAIPSNSTDYNGDGAADNAFSDATDDGFIDDFDVFIRHYDTNGDNRLTLSTALTEGTPAFGSAAEFTVDDDLALLIDSANPDRNRNGVSGFVDANSNGKWDAGEAFADWDAAQGVNRDQVLGYRDGYIDKRDRYAKVAGRLSFKTTSPSWSSAQGAIAPKLRGPIRPSDSGAAQGYGLTDEELPDISPSIFDDSRTALQNAANGATFQAQVATNLGVSQGALAGYVENNPAGSTNPRYLRLDPDNDLDGRPDNWATAYYEKMPFNAPVASDWYYRPVYENMVFKDVVIPTGTNALFKNCTFVGVTFVRTETSNGHVLWSEYGKMTVASGDPRPVPATPRIIYGDDPGETNYPSMLPPSATPPNQYVLMAAEPLDKGDIPADQVGITTGYSLLPDPLVLNGQRITDTRRLSNNIRFHDCLFVGSIVSDAPGNYTQTRNKLQFTGSTRFVDKHPTSPDDPALNPEADDRAEIAKSSMMLPQMSVDIGSFNSPPSQNVALKGAIIAGVLDVRGNASIDGALLLTYSPVYGEGPLQDAGGNPAGNPADFNASIGYFGPDDGDEESLDPTTLPIVGGVRIVGWDTNGDGMADVPATQAQPPGSTAVPFNGYGGITLRFNPLMTMPNGIRLPMQYVALESTYREGKP